MSAFFKPCADLSFKAHYTYTDARDKDTEEQLARRPKDKIGFSANYRFLERGNLNLEVMYVGKRPNTTGGKKLGSYAVANIAAFFDISKNVRIFGRIENLFDDDYEETLGFGVPGIGFYGGAKIVF